MGFFSKITRAITKPIKKIIKSPIGKAALIGGLGYLTMGGSGGLGLQNKGWMNALKAGWKGVPIGMPGSESTLSGIPGLLYKGAGFAARNKVPLAIAGAAGLGTAAMAKGAEQEEPSWAGDKGTGHADYLKARKLWDWGGEDPMFAASQGGRVHAQQGMAVGQGQGITSIQTDARADPGSLSEIDRPTEQGVLDTGTTEQSDDAKLIQLIQQLAALGIPMEQLRGRTEQELVEMMVYMSSQMGNQQGGGRAQMAQGGDNSLFLEESSEVIRGGQDGDSVVDQTEEIEGQTAGPDWFTIRVQQLMNEGMSEEAAASQAYDEGPGGQDTSQMGSQQGGNQMAAAQGGITRTGYAMGTEHPVIPSKDGKQLDMRDTGGYQPHGAKEKHDDVRALLAQGEFVMTSDAVKGLGGGDRDAGAKKMYDVMHNLEAMA
jgi:hypothetical protein